MFSCQTLRRPPFQSQSVDRVMAGGQGQDMFDDEGKSEVINDLWGDLQSSSTPDNLQEFYPKSQNQNSQNEVQACEGLRPNGSCAWVDCADQVFFIFIF